MEDRQTLLERIRNCSSCAQRRELMKQYAERFGGFATAQFERLRSAANITALNAARLDSRRFANMKRKDAP